jgi:asparagine synthase (glutamine-hydrolysing)
VCSSDLVRETSGKQYYNLDRSLTFDDDISFHDAGKIFNDAFTSSVSLRLISDVNVGLFLSAGIDSNAILSAAAKSSLSVGLQTFTLEYSDGYNESELARRAAEIYGVSYKAIAFSELKFVESLDRIVSLFDQPFGNATAIVSDMIAAEASKTCKVCLAGDGGDELLVGYPRYKALNHFRQLDLLPSTLKRAIIASSRLIPERGPFAVAIRRAKQFTQGLNKPIEESFVDWSTYLDTQSLEKALGEKAPITPFYSGLIDSFNKFKSDPVRAATILDMKSFVPFNLMQSADRTSMAHSLELRSPFLSTSLIHACLGMPSRVRLIKGMTKPLLTVPFAQDIPGFILKQPKRPFNPPIRIMLQKNLDTLEDYLLSSDSRLCNVMSKTFIADQVREFRVQRRDNSTFLWGLATLENWLRRF